MHLARFFLAGILVAFVAFHASARTWTDQSGKTVLGTFLGMEDGMVVLQARGRTFHVPYERFSNKDRNYILGQMQARGEAHLVPGHEASGPAGVIPGAAATPSPPANAPSAPPETVPNEPSIDDESVNSAGDPIEIKTRRWTDTSGNSIQARFIRIYEEKVVLMQGRKVVTVPMEQLSSVDMDYVRDVMISRGEGDVLPSAEELARRAAAPDLGGAADGGAIPGARSNPSDFRSKTSALADEIASRVLGEDDEQNRQGGYGTEASAPAPSASSYNGGGSEMSSAGYDPPSTPGARPPLGPRVTPPTPAPYTPPTPNYGADISAPTPDYSTNAADMESGFDSGKGPPPAQTRPPRLASRISTPSPPNFSTPHLPNTSLTQNESTNFYCSHCNEPVPETATGSCPHCNAKWDYEEQRDGSVKRNSIPIGIGTIVAFLVTLAGIAARLFRS